MDRAQGPVRACRAGSIGCVAGECRGVQRLFLRVGVRLADDRGAAGDLGDQTRRELPGGVAFGTAPIDAPTGVGRMLVHCVIPPRRLMTIGAQLNITHHAVKPNVKCY
jgi:hypothetical protein